MLACCAVGVRPNFVKIAPILRALDAAGIESVLVHTGQHYDTPMSQVFFDELGIREPDVNLGVGSAGREQQISLVSDGFAAVLARLEPDVVIVVGDVNSTLGCALASASAGTTLAHVEAGLRSGDLTMPEEDNRIRTDALSDLLFAPSSDAVDNLRAEGLPESGIHLVGNVMADSLLAALDRARCSPVLRDLGLRPGAYALATLHRPSTVDESGALDEVLEALDDVAQHLPVVLPAPPRLAARLDRRRPTGVRIVPAVGYLDFLALELHARLVLTDSGGVQEETTMLGVPCLTLRDGTERPITVSLGTNDVVGRKRADIVSAARAVLAGGHRPGVIPPLWDGRTAERIVAVVGDLA